MDYITKLQLYFVILIIITINLLTILNALNLFSNAKFYLDTVLFYFKMYLSLYMIYRFNSFRHIKFTVLDKEIAFFAGILVFSTTILDTILKHYLHEIKEWVSNNL